jgi:hypothetical protein
MILSLFYHMHFTTKFAGPVLPLPYSILNLLPVPPKLWGTWRPSVPSTSDVRISTQLRTSVHHHGELQLLDIKRRCPWWCCVCHATVAEKLPHHYGTGSRENVIDQWARQICSALLDDRHGSPSQYALLSFVYPYSTYLFLSVLYFILRFF